MRPCIGCGSNGPRYRERDSYCRECQIKKTRAWVAANPERAREQWKKQRFAVYGITEASYEALLAAQGGGCAVCGVTSWRDGRRLCIDHDHSCCPSRPTCGRCVRGLLCGECNRAIGILREDPVLLSRAAAYLVDPPGPAVFRELPGWAVADRGEQLDLEAA